jgi:uncharacterized integral membrane protein
LLFLAAFVGAVVLFAIQNQDTLTLKLFEWKVTATVAAVIGAAFGLGMLSGWSVVGLLRRSLHRISEEPQRQRAA